MTSQAMGGASESKAHIPHQLGGCRFIRLGYHSKIPAKGQKDHFRSDECNYAIDDPALIRHIGQGGNYGVIPRGGVCVIDADSQALWDAIHDEWKGSFTVKTGRDTGAGRHLFLLCKDAPGKIKVIFPGKIGDIRLSGSRFYTVGPGSVHPDTGMQYTVLNDAPILAVPWAELSQFIEANRGELEVSEEARAIVRHAHSGDGATIADKYNLRPEDHLMPDNPEYLGTTIMGAHPIHGSSGGSNLHIDTAKGVWYCFRCKSGGNGLSAYAISKGIISCNEAKPGWIDDKWHAVFNALEEGGIKPVFDPVIPGFADRILERANRKRGGTND